MSPEPAVPCNWQPENNQLYPTWSLNFFTYYKYWNKFAPIMVNLWLLTWMFVKWPVRAMDNPVIFHKGAEHLHSWLPWVCTLRQLHLASVQQRRTPNGIPGVLRCTGSFGATVDETDLKQTCLSPVYDKIASSFNNSIHDKSIRSNVMDLFSIRWSQFDVTAQAFESQSCWLLPARCSMPSIIFKRCAAMTMTQ